MAISPIWREGARGARGVVSSFMQIGGRKSAPSSWLRIALSARPKRVRNTDMGHPALLRSTLPPDNGYDLETANALYAALAEVLGGQSSPADAVAGIDQKLG